MCERARAHERAYALRREFARMSTQRANKWPCTGRHRAYCVTYVTPSAARNRPSVIPRESSPARRSPAFRGFSWSLVTLSPPPRSSSPCARCCPERRHRIYIPLNFKEAGIAGASYNTHRGCPAGRIENELSAVKNFNSPILLSARL